MAELLATIKRGEHKGKPLFPHKHEDNKYVASTSRFKDDNVRVDSIDELVALVNAGYGVRMSNPTTGNAPSFIANSSLNVGNEESKSKAEPKELLPKIIEDTDLDSDSITKVRKEQSFLRAYLLNGSITSSCVICGHEFPFDMLVAAHLKRRSECSIEEKMDFDSVAALMCKTGCDDLYEKGYIIVKSGKVVKSKKPVTTRLAEVIESIAGTEVRSWAGSSKYYAWHENKFNK